MGGPGWPLWATPPLHPLPLSGTGMDATFIFLMFVLIAALIAGGAALACFIRWVPPPHGVLWGSGGTLAWYRVPEGVVTSAASVSPPCRRRIQQAQLMKGPNKIILTMEDLTFINTQSSKQVRDGWPWRWGDFCGGHVGSGT